MEALGSNLLSTELPQQALDIPGIIGASAQWGKGSSVVAACGAEIIARSGILQYFTVYVGILWYITIYLDALLGGSQGLRFWILHLNSFSRDHPETSSWPMTNARRCAAAFTDLGTRRGIHGSPIRCIGARELRNEPGGTAAWPPWSVNHAERRAPNGCCQQLPEAMLSRRP